MNAHLEGLMAVHDALQAFGGITPAIAAQKPRQKGFTSHIAGIAR